MPPDDRLPYMPWYPRDFLSATRGWNIMQRAVYRELLDAQWDSGGLPSDEGELMRLIGASAKEWAAGWPKCRTKFEVCSDGLRRNARLEAHRGKSLELKETRTTTARKAAQARWSEHAGSNASSMLGAVLGGCPPTPTPTPTQTQTQTPEKTKTVRRAAPAKGAVTWPPWFVSFKMAMPKRAGDPNWSGAIRAANARIEEGHNPEEFIAAAGRYAAYVKAIEKDGTEFVMQASRFLGPSKPFLEPWDPPPNKAQRRQDSNVEKVLNFINEDDA